VCGGVGGVFKCVWKCAGVCMFVCLSVHECVRVSLHKYINA
jgi:hypothetical protein